MYSRRAALITFGYLRREIKVCRRNPSDFGCSVEIPNFVRNFRTATGREDFYNNFDGDIVESQSSYVNRNRNDQFYGRNLGGFEQNQNPSRVYVQIGTDRLDLYNTSDNESGQNQQGYSSASFESRLHGSDIFGGAVKQIPGRLHVQNFGGQLGTGTFQLNMSCNGYGNGGTLDRTPQNGGRVYPENSRGGSYGGKEDVPVKNVDSAGVHQHNVAGGYYSNARDYRRSLSESQSGVGIEQNQNPSRVYGKIGIGTLDLYSIYGIGQNQPGYKLASFYSRLYGRNVASGEVNLIRDRLHSQNFGEQLGNGTFQPNVSSNGYVNGGTLDRTPQNGGGVYPENLRGGSFGGNEGLRVKSVDSAEVHPQYVAGSYLSNTGDYPRSLSESQSGVGMYCPVGTEQNQNSSGVYGKIGTNRLDLSNTFGRDNDQNQPSYDSASFDSRLYARNIVRGEVNRIPNPLYGQNFGGQLVNGKFQQNVTSNGYINGGISDRMPQNGGGVYQENLRGGSYGGKEDMPVKNVDSAGVHSQNIGQKYYSNAGDYPRSLSESQSGVGMYSPVVADVALNAGSVKVVQESQSARTLDDLDQFTREGRLKEAVELLRLLEKESFQVELPHYMALVKACGENEALAEAKSVYEHLVKSKVHLEVWTYNQILEMYSKCGSMKDAIAVFDQMPNHNLTSWDIMISWLAKNGHGEESLELFSEFKQSGLRPDGQMFHGVFSACGVVCDMIEGMLQFESMIKDYGIVPAMEHYVSIVDMLGSAGFLDEALEFIQKMPVEASVEIWETLMKLCRIHGNTVLGDQCAELVELLDPARLNEQSREGLIPLYASDLEKEKEKKKLSGAGPLDVRHKVHEYRAGDRSHPDNDRLYGLLRGLKEQMKEAGYVPELKCVLHDVDHESKEEALMAHSERLAAAHGFLTSPPRATVRIIKNLRVCSDCHNVFKIISKLVGREIVARDSKRFHHFKDGSCTCGDFW